MNEVSKALFGVYGAGGCGRGVMPVLCEMLARNALTPAYDVVFVDDRPGKAPVNGHMVMTYADFVAAEAEQKAVCLAIANSRVRERLAARCGADGIESLTVLAPNSVIMEDVSLGEGAIISPYVTIASNVVVGDHFQANLYSYVEHDCIVGNFVTFAPGVHCNGNVTIEDHAYLGAGCLLRQGAAGDPLVIGRGAVIGMGAVVTKSVPAGITVVGNPARPLHRGASVGERLTQNDTKR